MTKKKNLTEDDAALWQQLTEGVTPLNKDKRSGEQAPVVPRRKKTNAAPGPKRMSDVPADQLIPSFDRRGKPVTASKTTPDANLSGKLDGRRAQRLKRGQLPIEGRVDLHGMTQEKAFNRLNRFLAASQAQDKRCVLVITGKGGSEIPDPDNIFATKRTGVLRHAVPQWLSQGDNAHRVVAWYPARPQHGGDGALYVVLKRLR